MPVWPGPFLIVAGALLVLGAFVVTSMETLGELDVRSPETVLALGAVGGIALSGGIAYAAVHQIRVRRHLPPERYRGPNILALVALVFIAGIAATLPFGDDVAALLEGRAPSLLGTLVILTGTQVALLLVAWLFVGVPKALAGLPRWTGRDPARDAAMAVGIGFASWIGASVLAAVIAAALEASGVEPEPQAAEQALHAIDPWLVVVPVVVLAPIAEEIFFRGVVLNALLREAGTRWATFGSATLFAIVHASVIAFVPILALGVILAWVARRTRGLLAPMIVHATFNGLSVIVALLVRYDVIVLPT
jgi:membrane protease YdiL (CAAX protease family)